MLQKIRPASSSTDHLFVGTDRYTYFTVSWDAKAKELRTEKSYVDTADKSARDSQTGDRCLIDPTRKFLTLELFEGVVTVIPFLQKGKRKGAPAVDVGNLGDPLPSRISELFVRSSAFLYPRKGVAEKPRLALLYEDNHQKVRVRIRELEYAAGGTISEGYIKLDEVKSITEELELGASHIIPVPAPACTFSLPALRSMLNNVRWRTGPCGDLDNILRRCQQRVNVQAPAGGHNFCDLGTNRRPAMAYCR